MPLPMVREGTCQPEGCGSACCRFLLLEVNPAYLWQSDVAKWVRLHGIELGVKDDRVYAKIPLQCTALDVEPGPTMGDCMLHGTPERPQMCEDFPQAPEDLAGLADVCSFSFRRADDGVQGGQR